MALNLNPNMTAIEQARVLRWQIAHKYMALSGIIAAGMAGAFIMPYAEVPILEEIKKLEAELAKVEASDGP